MTAIATLAPHFADLNIAPLYRTTPVSDLPQGTFLNSVIVGRTTTSAEDLLALAQALERSSGRQRDVRCGPRQLDLDLLFWGDRVSEAPELTLPHPRLFGRRFVLQPLADLIPNHRICGRTVDDWLATSAVDEAMTVQQWHRDPLSGT